MSSQPPWKRSNIVLFLCTAQTTYKVSILLVLLRFSGWLHFPWDTCPVCYFDFSCEDNFCLFVLVFSRIGPMHDTKGYQGAAIFTLMWTELNKPRSDIAQYHMPRSTTLPYLIWHSATVRHMPTCKCRTINNAQFAMLCACVWREIATCKYSIVLNMLIYADISTYTPYYMRISALLIYV